MTDIPASLQPFVLPGAAPSDQRVDRVGDLDLYRPASTARAAAILFVHGVPTPEDLGVPPRDWLVYQGYASAAAQRGLVGVTVDHRLIHGLDQLAAAADDVEAAVSVLRADPQVDPDRVALWFFSSAGLLAGEWLDSRPDWLRCVALTYPLLSAPPGVDELVSAVEVIGKHHDLPVLLTRVGLERAELAAPVAEFVTAAGAAVDLIDVPSGQHGFDMLDHTEEARSAVTRALDWVAAHLGAEPADGNALASSSQPSAQPSMRLESSRLSQPGATVTVAPPVPPPPASVSADTPAARLVAQEHTAYNAHDLESFLATYSPTAKVELADGTVKTGRRELREHYRPLFEAGRCKAEVTGRMTHDEWVVDQTTSYGSDHGPESAIALYRVQDGSIVEVRFLG